MIEKNKRAQRPRHTVQEVFFHVGVTCGRLVALAEHFEGEPASLGGDLIVRVRALMQRFVEASQWPQQQALTKSVPVLDELTAICRELDAYVPGKTPMSDVVRQLEAQLRQLLPPDVRL